MFRPFWPPIDDPKTVSFDVAARLERAGYPREMARLGWGKKPEDGYYRLWPAAEAEVAAPSASELLAYYLESGTLDCVTLFCRRSDYMALDQSVDRRAATPDDAIGELVLAKLVDKSRDA